MCACVCVCVCALITYCVGRHNNSFLSCVALLSIEVLNSWEMSVHFGAMLRRAKKEKEKVQTCNLTYNRSAFCLGFAFAQTHFNSVTKEKLMTGNKPNSIKDMQPSFFFRTSLEEAFYCLFVNE